MISFLIGMAGGFTASLVYAIIIWYLHEKKTINVDEIVKDFVRSKAFTVSKKRKLKIHDDNNEWRKENGIIGQ